MRHYMAIAILALIATVATASGPFAPHIEMEREWIGHNKQLSLHPDGSYTLSIPEYGSSFKTTGRWKSVEQNIIHPATGAVMGRTVEIVLIEGVEIWDTRTDHERTTVLWLNENSNLCNMENMDCYRPSFWSVR